MNCSDWTWPGWGTASLAREGKNLFGVKADPAWHVDVMYINTREYLNGAWTTVAARWRKYADWQDCMDDHAAFLHQNRRYAACFACTTGDAFAKAVAKAGYATDPDYAAKLISIIDQYQLADRVVSLGSAGTLFTQKAGKVLPELPP